MEFRIPRTISGAPNPTTPPLVVVVAFETDETSYAEIEINDGVRSRTERFDKAPAKQHSCVVLGLRPDTTHTLTARARNPATLPKRRTGSN